MKEVDRKEADGKDAHGAHLDEVGAFGRLEDERAAQKMLLHVRYSHHSAENGSRMLPFRGSKIQKDAPEPAINADPNHKHVAPIPI